VTDLVPLATAESYLGPALPPDTAALQAVLSAASSAIRKWTGRDFTRQDYTEFYDGLGYSQLVLYQYPVNNVTRVACYPVPVLTVANLDTTTNQRAYATLAYTGDFTAGQTVTGLTLSRVASGVTTSNTVLFASNVTLGAVATAVNNLGAGWDATVADGFAQWASADLWPNQGGQSAIGAGAQFQIPGTDVSGFTVDQLNGFVRFNNATYDPIFSIMNIVSGPLLTTFPPMFQGVRVSYNAGYATVPYDVQQACLVTVKVWLYDLQTDPRYTSETADKWSYTLGKRNHGLPDEVVRMLGPWKSYRLR
jgi:hypothetical protein